ncbi:unnamed protein product [Polarella glacialis]|uniref:Transmembrane 9 superfamily member n=1 Tax=Polarella glacialis TaxID=89957 RepID=A0A813JQR1_POLGL|nr:unnamed protein product [Polarella glacialis]
MKNCPWMTPLSRQSELIGRLEQEASQARSYWLMMQRVETWLSPTAGSSHRARLQKQDTPQDVVPLSRQNSRRSATLLPNENGVRPLDGHGLQEKTPWKQGTMNSMKLHKIARAGQSSTPYPNAPELRTVDMEPSNPWPIYEGAPLSFSYSATWFPTTKGFEDRHSRYLDPKFFEHKVHWFSIVNSFMLSLFLCAVVAIILMKTLKRDFTRYSASEAEELESLDGVGDESGWKQVNGDVFRRPDHLSIFTVVYASGCHLACTVFIVLVFAICNSYYASRGATATSFVISYLVTVIVGGYEGGRIFRMFGGQHWKRTMIYQVLFLPGIVFIGFIFINTTAIMYGATMTVPFKTVFIILVLFLAVCVPLHTAGTLLGRRAAAERTFPCRVHHLKRPIPTKHWAFLPAMIVTAGIVPFGCLFIEMYFILSAVWSHNKIYYVYGFMFAILLLLSIVIVCVSITCTYVLLNTEDYRWQWQSFLSCGATSIYVFLYTIQYFYSSTQMSGFLQTVYYFGTSLNFCIGLGLVCGSVGFIGASKFVFLIYSNIKAE